MVTGVNPAVTIFTREAGETVTDEWYTAVSDGDGHLCDLLEDTGRTAPPRIFSDSDGDGLSDGAEDADCQALRYVFEVYADAQLTTLVTATAAGGEAEDDNTTAWQASSLLNDNTDYYWRARAVDFHGAAGPWSATVSFFVNTANDPPAVPVLNNPVSGGGGAVLSQRPQGLKPRFLESTGPTPAYWACWHCSGCCGWGRKKKLRRV